MIEVHNVSKIYRPSKQVEVVALHNITITIKKGEFVAILGSSGSGKSTLLYVIGLLERPTSGTVRIENKDTASLDDEHISRIRGEMVGFVFQQFNLIPNLTVLANVLLPSRYTPKPQAESRAIALLETFGIGSKVNAYPNQLSGGQQQRVAIARALMNNPNIIIADEPTGNLDSKTGKQIVELLQEIHKKEEKTIIIVTHDASIAAYAKRIIHIQDGELQ
ncbi:macrolide ABC transporter ATP-binding protein [Candidatus Roizmanbacteria bacterium CG10_big_fil_rev_8_21_14_0_10_45_7]|uniref:Macrolide ABC transporter ATP-binding protein n=1 Tax=Candidatus Roizmanbacteria bacterium CG10_big_fil_rev_8_21_14_0_10_45_7 TaxID=1974854 RepID=A0A2M8KUK2_9BACT|nr:MAG: macrolide ABC transporter ATP-binding protein [Candidatus Roizmanbacteria bacterium CG10_big_fil_rev_8_21_14_0_10_45_7]